MSIFYKSENNLFPNGYMYTYMDKNFHISYVYNIDKLPVGAKEVTIHEFYDIVKVHGKAFETSCSPFWILCQINALKVCNG